MNNLNKIEFIPKDTKLPWDIMLVFPDLGTSNEAMQHIHLRKDIKFVRRWNNTIIEVEVLAESSTVAIDIIKSAFKKNLAE